MMLGDCGDGDDDDDCADADACVRCRLSDGFALHHHQSILYDL